jgi:hypothetical protein
MFCVTVLLSTLDMSSIAWTLLCVQVCGRCESGEKVPW